MFQVFIASTDAWSTGPESHRPLPCTQANSPPERLTPSSRYGLPSAVTIWLPDACSFGAAPLGGGLVVVGLGVGVVTDPVQVVPLSANDAGTGFAPLHEPLNPIEVEALVRSDPFQLRLAADTRGPAWVQVAPQPWVTFWLALGKSNVNVQLDSASPRLVTLALAVNPPGH